MAHFAQIDANNNVLQVVVISNADIDNLPFPESEPVGVAFCQNLFGENTNWKQTSYNGNFRREFAAVGGFYYPAADVFVGLQPYPSWVFDNQTAQWVAPVPQPDVAQNYVAIWIEDQQKWVTVLNRGAM